jgi:hypothetical protein
MTPRLKKAIPLLLGALAASALIPVLISLTAPSAPAASTCPDESRGEKAEDCPWAGLTRDLEQVASQNGLVIEALEKEQPVLFYQMKTDAKRKSWLNLWGKCINFDELAKGIIISPKIIDPLVQMFAPPSGQPFEANGREIVHAGVQHTYGYLFSNLQTSFGYKRARWVRDTLDKGFGLPIGILSPMAKSGSLFSNATYFAGRIAFKNEPANLKTLEKGVSKAVSAAVVSYDFNSLKPTRLEEIIKTPTGDVIIRTDFVPFLHPVEGDSNTHWLVYSIADHRQPHPKGLPPAQLITAFPVETSFVESALAADSLGENKPIITRYNAYVDGITGTAWTGLRRKL